MYHIVYLTTNLVNNKIYVGVHSTWNLEDGYLGSGQNIKRAIKKYGEKNFERKILYFCLSIEDMNYIESFIVDQNFLSKPNTYNLVIGGQSLQKQSNGMFGKKHTEETKQVMRAKRIEYFQNLDPDEKLKQNIKKSIKQKGIPISKPRSKEHCENMSKAKKGCIPWNKNKKFDTPITKEKRKALSIAGSKPKPPRTEEHKRKLSEAAKDRWEKRKLISRLLFALSEQVRLRA